MGEKQVSRNRGRTIGREGKGRKGKGRKRKERKGKEREGEGKGRKEPL